MPFKPASDVPRRSGKASGKALTLERHHNAAIAVGERARAFYLLHGMLFRLSNVAVVVEEDHPRPEGIIAIPLVLPAAMPRGALERNEIGLLLQHNLLHAVHVAPHIGVFHCVETTTNSRNGSG